MPQNQYFIQNLIELRSHYQSLIGDAERDSNNATEQLNHITALLVDQLVEDQQFTESLIQLREHYQSLHQKSHQKTQNAKEQITHVNALLADSLVLQHSQQQPIPIQAATLEQQALLGVIADKDGESQRQEPELTPDLKPPEILEQRITSDSNQEEDDGAIATPTKESPQQNLEVAESPESLQVSEPQIPTDSHQVEQQPELEPPTELPDVEDSPNDSERWSHSEPPSASLIDKPVPSASSRKAAPLKTPLLPQYQHLTKSSAIENLLHEHSGTILHVDFILRALYGELSLQDITAEMPRINDSLKKGVVKGLWDRVPNEVGCYTADIKLVDSEVEPKLVEAKKRQSRKPNSKATERMLPRYRNLTFTDAVESVMRDRSGEIITSDIMARALYGELEGPALVEARNKIGKVLWSGANQGRWQSVAGQKGAYTLDLKLVGL
ncbi:MAG: hypothetical protein KME05_06525 [Gloeocapsa sp. UFS-A4-WI-NPMV-4B04]|jgi:hypothetical protein|nr:hypothetical protein [Gloeocapsa sp. UFS-A4-WI-NPMV-4B04]